MPRYSSRSIGSVSSISRRCTRRPSGPGLVRDQRHAEHLLGDFGRFRGIFRDLHAAAFAAAAGVNLRLHHHAAADLLRRRFGFLHRVRHFAARHRDVVFGQDGLRLILVNFHIGYGVGRRKRRPIQTVSVSRAQTTKAGAAREEPVSIGLRDSRQASRDYAGLLPTAGACR